MKEMGTKCFDILSMFHRRLLRVLLQYSSPLLILISHNGADCCACKVTRLSASVLWKHTHTHSFLSNMPIYSPLCNQANVCVCVCEMCDVFISVYTPRVGALKLNFFFFFKAFGCFSLLKNNGISAFSSSADKH